MSQLNGIILEKKLEKYEALKQKIAHSIERVVNKEILDKSKANIVQTLEGVKLIRNNFQREFQHITVELHKDLLAHFENIQLTDSGFIQMHEYYLKFIEKLEEKHFAMTSECDEIVSKIEEIYRKKIDELKESERQLMGSRQQLNQQEQLSEKKSVEGSDRQVDSPASDNPSISKESSSHRHHLQQPQANPNKPGVFGKVISLLGKKQKEGAEPSAATEMKLGSASNFKYDPVKRKWIFEGEEEQVDEDVPMPPKMRDEKKNKEEAAKEQPEQQDKSQLGKADMLKPHTSNLGFMKKKQGAGGPKQPVGMMKPMNVFAPTTFSQQNVYSSETTSSVVNKEKPLCVKIFEDLEILLSGLSMGDISSSSYLQPLNEIVALAKEDAEHLSDNQLEIDTYKQELEKAYQLLKTYEALSVAKDEAFDIVMQSQKQANVQLFSVRIENEALQSSVEFYKDLMDSRTVSTADEDNNEHGSRSIVKEGHFEALMNELNLQERITRLSDEVNTLRLREAELETKCKLAEERAELYRNRMDEEQEREFQQLYTFIEEKSSKDDIALKFMTRSYELGQKLEARAKKIRALNGLCRQISDEVRAKNNQISELSHKLKRTGERIEQKEADIQSRDEIIRGLENELGLAAKDKKLINSLQLEKNTLQKSLEHSKKELSVTHDNLNQALLQSKATIEQLEKRLETEHRHKEDLFNKLEEQSSRVLDLSAFSEFAAHLGKIANVLQAPLNYLSLEGEPLEIVEKFKRFLEDLAQTAAATLQKHEIEKESLMQEIEVLKTAYYQEREASEQAQRSLSEEINNFQRELKNERETLSSSGNQLSHLRADYDLILSKYGELVQENVILETKNQELLEKLAENLKQQVKFAQKYKLIRDGYAKQRQALDNGAVYFQHVQENSQGSYEELRYYYEELQGSYDEIRSAYEELKAEYHELRGDYEAHEASSQTLKGTYDELRSAHDEIHVAYDTLKKAFDENRTSQEQANSAYSEVKGAYEELGREYNQLRQAYEQLRQGYDKLNNAYQNLNQKYEEHRSKHESSGTSALQMSSQYENLRAEYENLLTEYDQLKNSYQQLEDLTRDQQGSNELLRREKETVEANFKAANQVLLAKLQELETSVEILSQQRERTNEEAFQETMSQLVSERARVDTLSQQLATALTDRDSSKTNNENVKGALEAQVETLKRENELLREEITSLQTQDNLKETQSQDKNSNVYEISAQYDEAISNIESVRAQNAQLLTELKQEQANRENIENTLNTVQGEYEQLRTRLDSSPRKIGDSKFSEHILDALNQSYKEFVSSELPMDQGDLVLKLLEKLNKFKNLHTNIQEKDEEIQNLSSRFEETQNENNRLLDTIALLESERNESEELSNLKSLLEKKSKRLDELNKIIDDKNKELEKLREANATAALKKESLVQEHAKGEVSKETESLKKEIAQLREQNKAKAKQLEDQAENLGFAEQRLKLMKEELDIYKLSHNEEIDALNKEIKKKVDTEVQLKKQLLDMKSLEPSVQVIDKKPIHDPKAQPVQAKASADTTAGAKKNDKTPPLSDKSSPEKLSPETNNATDASKNPEPSLKVEDQKKAQGGFLTSVASFFLTDNEKKKIVKE